MSVFVLDASVAAAWLLDESTSSGTDLALVRLEDEEAVVPQLWHLELRNCLLVASRRARLTSDTSMERLNALRDLPIRTDSEPQLNVAWALAERHRLSFYDAVYLELAKRHTAPLATLDKALARAAAAENLSLVCPRLRSAGPP